VVRSQLPEQRVVVAVYDGGFATDHPDLDDSFWVNPGEVPGNGIDDDGNGVVDDVNGFDGTTGRGRIQLGSDTFHGTHVAGIIAAEDNGFGVTGVAAGHAQVMGLVAAMLRSSELATFERCVDYVVRMKQEHGVALRVMNASIGSHYRDASEQARWTAAVQKLLDADILLVVAANNGGFRNNLDDEPFFPAVVDLPNVVTVAAMDRAHDKLAGYSSYGPRTVELAAPGTGIRSTVPFGMYEVKEGTSMAAPYVSGVVARLFSEHPDLSAVEMRTWLLQLVTPDEDLEAKVSSGGWLDAARIFAAVGPEPYVSEGA
jgi:subtilisin family serine protease